MDDLAELRNLVRAFEISITETIKTIYRPEVLKSYIQKRKKLAI